jgi:hypothetical protein
MALAEQPITTGWTPPPAIVGFSGTAVEEESHILLSWTASGLSSTDFVYYIIYRREVGETEWFPIVEISSKDIVEYKDYTAGQTINYEYIIYQYKFIPGDFPLASDDSDIVTAGLSLDAWFIIDGTSMEVLELFVTDEEHSAVIQQETFEPLAGTRKRVVRGLKLGYEGSLTTLHDASVNRSVKAFFDTLSEEPGPHQLKSAFGDVWAVEFDSPSFKYKASGHIEVTIGWIEI